MNVEYNKIETAALGGDELAIAVAMAKGWMPYQNPRFVLEAPWVLVERDGFLSVNDAQGNRPPMKYEPHRAWSLGGPLLDSEEIMVVFAENDEGRRFRAAAYGNEAGNHLVIEETLLEAVCKAFVMLKFGETVMVPVLSENRIVVAHRIVETKQ